MNYDLVFEGGGAKGIVFVGAMEVFEERGHQYDRLLGTSAGAITAALLAAGYSSAAMLEALNEQVDGHHVFTDFLGVPDAPPAAAIANSEMRALLASLDVPFLPEWLEDKLDDWMVNHLATHPRFRHLYHYVEEGGWYTAEAFLAWLRRRLDTGHFNGEPRRFSHLTLSEFYAATGREISLVATDTSSERMLVLNHKTAPGCPLVYAVRMSMSIPLLWPEVVWQADWGRYRGRDVNGHLVVDGGLLSNFPIELLVSDEPAITAVMGEKRGDHVLGMLIDEALPVEGSEPVAATAEEKRLRFQELQTFQRLLRLANTATKAHDKMIIEAFEELVVRLPAEGYGTTEFDMNEARREALVYAGREAMQRYFARRDLQSFSLREAASADNRIKTHANRVATQMLRE